jgi:hypothetical protein
MERSTELRDHVLAGFEAFSSGDASSVGRDTSRHEGVRLIGTDPNEWFEGEQAAEVLKQEVQDTTDIEEVSPRDLDAFVEGTVGWVSGRVVWVLERVMNLSENSIGMRILQLARFTVVRRFPHFQRVSD